jgi:protein involved in polysaccharide export with SLBB domain
MIEGRYSILPFRVMSRHLHRLTILLFLFIILPGAVRAESNLSRAFAPWMALDARLQDRQVTPQQDDLRKTRLVHRVSVEKGKTPAAPVITPADTRALIDEIYSGGKEKSALEQSYSKRIVEELTQFGYDMFGEAGKDGTEKDDKGGDEEKFPMPAGAVQDDFLLNIGDRLSVSFRGQREDSKIYAVTGAGQLIVDDFPPLSAAGRSIGQVRDELEAETARMHNTQVFLSLESVRQVNVLVVGHVKKPGRQSMTVFHTVLDALMAAGGIEKIGSLRQIKLVRDGRSTIIDLYALLVHGSAIMDIGLRDGDRIIVPPVGPTLAVAGGVKRPGIYEILPVYRGMGAGQQQESQKLSLQEMVDMAGGLLNPGENRFMKLGLTKDGREVVDEIDSGDMADEFGAGSILMVAPSDEARADTVELRGETRRAGLHALDRTPTLGALIDSEKVLGPDIYPLIGVIERWDADQQARQMIAFPPLAVVKGGFDRRLQDGDIIHLFSRRQIMDLEAGDSGNEPVETGSAMGSLDSDAIDDPVMESFLRERVAFVRGAVRSEGAWPVADGVTLDNLIAISGGLALEANTSNIEVTSKLQGENGQEGGRSGTQRIAVNLRETNPDEVKIGPGDSVRVNQKFHKIADNSVMVIGEVEHPGRYDLMPGDKMSDLLRRAGGLTQQAYPDGTIFSRENERRAEEARFRAQAQDLEVKLASAMSGKEEPDENKIAAVQSLVTQLRGAEAVGRITVESDPAVLAVQPELDILLEAGDRVYIPKRPLTVRVAGEVLSPASLQFRKDKDPRDYIMQAGGFTFDSDKDRAFVIYPDGSAQPLLVNNWNHAPAMIPPGSTIVVPRDPKPFDFIQTAKDVSQILSNLAITGIFIEDIRSGD